VVYVVAVALSLVAGVAFGVVGAVLAGLISFLATFWTEAALVEAVQDIRDGRADLTIGETFRRVGPRLGAVIGASILAGLGIALGLVLLIVPGLTRTGLPRNMLRNEGRAKINFDKGMPPEQVAGNILAAVRNGIRDARATGHDPKPILACVMTDGRPPCRWSWNRSASCRQWAP